MITVKNDPIVVLDKIKLFGSKEIKLERRAWFNSEDGIYKYRICDLIVDEEDLSIKQIAVAIYDNHNKEIKLFDTLTEFALCIGFHHRYFYNYKKSNFKRRCLYITKDNYRTTIREGDELIYNDDIYRLHKIVDNGVDWLVCVLAKGKRIECVAVNELEDNTDLFTSLEEEELIDEDFHL